MKTTAREVAKALGTIRAALRSASEDEKAAIAESLRSLVALAGAAQAKESAPAPKSTRTPTAAEVNAAARSVIDHGKGWGDDKAFICDVHAALNTEMSLSAFRALLPSLRHEVSLSRADLVEAMDPALVSASECSYLSATFHFVRVS